MKRHLSFRNVFVFITGSLFTAVVIVALFALLGNVSSAQSQATAQVATSPVQSQATSQLQELSQTFRDVATAISPAVVYISTEQTVKATVPDQFQQFFGDEFFRQFFGAPEQREYKQQALGSGFLVSEDGYILTNNHVVENADTIKVTLPDKQEFDAKVIGTDPKSDVAVIKIDGNHLPVATLGDSSATAVGDWVLAIGTPYGLSQTVTAGIISAEGRANIGIVDYEDFIQTDAAINPGNSGGPLVNIKGEVIGINTAIFSRSGGYQGIGFAIPINMAKGIMDNLISHGKVIRGWLGVMIQPITPEIAKGFGLEETTGALVADVVKDGPADKAGIKRGDVIISLNGQPIDTPNTLKNLTAQVEVKKAVPVVIIRDGEEHTMQVTIGEQPTQEQASAQASGSTASAVFGLHVQELTSDIANQLGYTGDTGVIVVGVEPGSPAANVGLQRGDLIKEINRQPIESLADYQQATASLKKDEGLLLLVRRGENTYYVAVNAE
jgi:serine protease Do